MKNSTEKTFRG